LTKRRFRSGKKKKANCRDQSAMLPFSAWPSAFSAQSRSACEPLLTWCAVCSERQGKFAQLLGSHFLLVGRGAWAKLRC
jgi:hypothetical protein